MKDPRTAESRSSLLVELPAELRDMIFDNLDRFDLNRLCLTCKTIKAVLLPKLYKTVIIKVPQRWSRLPSLEGLLGSTGDGLKYTTRLSIGIQQDPLRDSQQGPQDSRPHKEIMAESRLQFYLPQSSASSSLNILVRILILKLGKDRLTRFRWDHGCELHVSTLKLVLERQGGHLRYLYCNRYSSSWDGATFPLVKGIRYLCVSSMNPDQSCEWPARMIAENAETLTHLGLGFSTRIAHNFARSRDSQLYHTPTSFTNAVSKILSELNQEPPLTMLRPNSLSLCGLDLRSVIEKGLGFDIDFSNIQWLRLESCSGLSQALPLLMGEKDSSNPALRALQSLFVRLENPDPNFSTIFENLLTSFHPLVHLRVLIDYTPTVQNLEPVLSVHGETLKTLVWDERRGPRVKLGVSTSLLSTEFQNLRTISQKCENLVVLGLSLDWEAISSSDRFHETIGECLRRMPKLEMLTIRNLPEVKGGIPPMSMDYFVKGLAMMFLDAVNKKQNSASFKTIALGAPLYRDIYIGTHHVDHTPVSDFLRFRVYNIDYKYLSPSGLSVVLSEVAKGATISTDEAPTDKYCSEDYWLG